MIELLAAATLYLPWPSVTCANDPRLDGGRHSALYSPDEQRIVLSLPICGNLERLQSPEKTVYYEDTFGLFTLAHELSHASGIEDEHEADCHAIAIWPNVARKVKVPAVKIRALREIIPKLNLPMRAHGQSC